MSRLRRDPRSERSRHRVEGAARPRFDLAAAPSGLHGRARRDPRAEFRLAQVPGTARLRLDRTQRVAALDLAPAARAPEPQAGPRLVAIPEPAFLVAAVPDAPGGRLTPHDRQLLGAARLLADAGGGAVLVLAGAPADELARAGADRVLALPVTGYDPEARAMALQAVLAGLDIRHVLLPESPEGGDLARRLAALTGEPLFAGAESLTARAVTRPAAGRRTEQRMVPPRLLTLAADAAAAHAGTLHEALEVAFAFPPLPPGAILSADDVPADPSRVPLAEADFVVSAGNGITDFASFHDLVEALHATPGASRVVCDAGLMPRAAQVGASGTVLEARCYFALGIAGAPQHLQGVARCEHVVAVNTDLHAAMIERAGLAVVADAQKVMPALLSLLAEKAADAETHDAGAGESEAEAVDA
ncbi:electron transfer flavoprotein subunit alpha/FixB family protein [Ancylobacter sp. MQZ15Z-1]|uniref:Electron transfer flavoprotein subunit alpha/FixB family protein n=1 Tax=Ancylobacter mangrovi TaxID=2972472 RepID=A0A9X2T8X7_9HYPH|nr:electron transfer flavoprotein subunit alpha/FixB family protein [Ancylobacter mangrovi]MCS0497618.1 electron transfer flavoprotein subunit alpha/FixB family protein [Ancylobacter mangrovi]